MSQQSITTDDKYTDTIAVPQYKIKESKPNIDELINKEKTNKLLSKIKQSGVRQEEKELLTLAAYRHLIFNYDKIADYYPHASKEMQELMEESALIIIDIDDAIMHGYIKASNQIKDIIERHNKGGNDEV